MQKGQSRTHSFYESCLNIAIGFGVALTAQVIIFPRFGIHIPLSTDLWISFWFTLVALARSYALRRVFNFIHCKGHKDGTH